jgi:hypothetical protein
VNSTYFCRGFSISFSALRVHLVQMDVIVMGQHVFDLFLDVHGLQIVLVPPFDSVQLVYKLVNITPITMVYR